MDTTRLNDRFDPTSNRWLLELASRYDARRLFQYVVTADSFDSLISVSSRLEQLKAEDLIRVRYEPYGDPTTGDKVVTSLALTTQGEQLLVELRARDRFQRIIKKAADLAWVTVTAIVTTLLTLWLSGK